MTAKLTTNPAQAVANGITTHIDQVPHGTTLPEQAILTALELHVDTVNRNPHGLIADDIDVYTKAQVNIKIEAINHLDGGGII
jgi:hypothetical protein